MVRLKDKFISKSEDILLLESDQYTVVIWNISKAFKPKTALITLVESQGNLNLIRAG
jgi:hypothetical protein